MRARLAVSCLFAAALLATSVDAHAGPPEEAKKHFDAGKKLRADGDCEKAIPEFEKSLSADPSIGAYYNLGYCQEQLGNRQDAYAAYRRARDMASAKKDDRLKEISGAIAALMETPHIRLVLPQPLPPGFKLRVDGEAVPEALYEAETILFTKSSPTHDVLASAPGYDDAVFTAETKQLKLVDLKKAGAARVEPPPAPPAEAPSTPIYRTRTFGATLGVLGLGAAAAGFVILIKYNLDLDKYQGRIDGALTACGDGVMISSARCLKENAPGTPKRENLVKAAADYNRRDDQGHEAIPLMATLFVAGGLLVAGGVLVILTAPDQKKAGALRPTFTPVLGPTVGGGAMTLRF